jgi:hypothetical protein
VIIHQGNRNQYRLPIFGSLETNKNVVLVYVQIKYNIQIATVQELCHQICDRIGITDDSGFSVYITLMQRVSLIMNNRPFT